MGVRGTPPYRLFKVSITSQNFGQINIFGQFCSVLFYIFM